MTMILTSFAVLVVLSELVLGMYFDRIDEMLLTELSHEYHHNYVPNASGIRRPTMRDEFGEVRIIINELGMRGEAPPLEKEIHEKRVLILGDSFVQADEMPLGKTMGYRLEKIIESKNIAAKIRVVQHGMASWSPLLELNWLNKMYDRLQPDMVLLVLCINDFFGRDSEYGDAYYSNKANYDRRGMPDGFMVDEENARRQRNIYTNALYKLTFPQLRYRVRSLAALIGEKKEKREPITQSVLDRMLLSGPADLERLSDRHVAGGKKGVMTREFIRLARDETSWDEATKENVRTTLHYVELMSKMLSGKGAVLAVALTPFGWNVSADETVLGKAAYNFAPDVILPDTGIQRKVKSYCRQTGIIFFDIKAIVIDRRESSKEKLFLQMDGHWNEAMHDLLAENFYRLLMEEKLLAVASK